MTRLKDNIRQRKKKLKAKRERKSIFLRRFFLLFLLLILLGGFFRFYQSVKRSSWQGDSRFNVVFNSSPLLIASFNNFEKEVNFLLIPQGTFIETIHGYGPCQSGSIEKLGEINNQGGHFLAKSLETYLGLPVDGYLFSLQDTSLEGDLSSVKAYLLANFSLFSKARQETSLTYWDLFRLWWYLKKTGTNKFNMVDLGATQASEEIVLPDGEKAIKVDPDRLELLIAQFFSDKKIKEEDLTMVVLNGTEHSGLASKMANLLKNIGGQVIKVGEITTFLKNDEFNCEIRSARKYRDSYTVKKISRIFNCRWGGEDLLNERSLLVIITKENYWKLLNLP